MNTKYTDIKQMNTQQRIQMNVDDYLQRMTSEWQANIFYNYQCESSRERESIIIWITINITSDASKEAECWMHFKKPRSNLLISGLLNLLIVAKTEILEAESMKETR